MKNLFFITLFIVIAGFGGVFWYVFTYDTNPDQYFLDIDESLTAESPTSLDEIQAMNSQGTSQEPAPSPLHNEGSSQDSEQSTTQVQSSQTYENTESTPTPPPSLEPSSTSSPSVSPVSPQTTSSSVTQCSSIECMINLAQTCARGEIDHSMSMEFPFMPESGIILNTETYMSLDGFNDGGACVLTQKPQGGSVTVTEQGRQDASSQGLSDQEINEQIEAMNEAYNDPLLLSSVTTCTGTASNMSSYLSNIQNGQFSSSCTFSAGQESQCIQEPNITCVTRVN